MPTVIVQNYLYETLNGLALPAVNTGPLTAYIMPVDPDPNPGARAYIWDHMGSESRLTSPRGGTQAIPGTVASPGWKQMEHSCEILLTWFLADDDPGGNYAFQSIIDAVMGTLRGTVNPVVIPDPVTGNPIAELVDVGERMTWEVDPVHALAVQRWDRLDCLITARIMEFFQG
jgi:hypothetical protein